MSPKGLPLGKAQLHHLTGLDACQGVDYNTPKPANARPTCGRQDDNGYSPAFDPLLMPQVLVGRDQDIEFCLGRASEARRYRASPILLHGR